MNKILAFMFLLIFINGLFITSFCSVSASSELVEDSWNTKTPMLQARAGLGVVAVADKIYAIGGYAADGYVVGTNECYDPKKDTWVTLKSMPTPRRSFAMAVYDEKIYCIGGSGVRPHWANGGNPYEPIPLLDLNVNEVYDPVTDSWSTKMSMPVEGSNLQAHVVGGKIFIIDFYGNLFMYDVVKDSWTKQNSVPVDSYTYVHFSVALDNKILFYLVQYVPAVDVEHKIKFMLYDTKTDKWSEGNMPSVIAGYNDVFAPFASRGFAGITSGVFAPQKIYFFSSYNETLIYEPKGDIWSVTKAMPTNRGYGFGVAVVDDIFYIIGGTLSDFLTPVCSVNEQYVPLGYHNVLSLTGSSSAAPVPSTSLFPLSFLGFFLTVPILVVIVLIIGVTIVTSLFFYAKWRKIIV